jgi:hypothetical protein
MRRGAMAARGERGAKRCVVCDERGLEGEGAGDGDGGGVDKDDFVVS